MIHEETVIRYRGIVDENIQRAMKGERVVYEPRRGVTLRQITGEQIGDPPGIANMSDDFLSTLGIGTRMDNDFRTIGRKPNGDSRTDSA
ncbi:hypothetical protein FHS92_003089 [Sphingobium subterraneum]|uniref:Uncharacterized protein n=1 Tax=Sphingobium subterraneum TaxID=627688 RepID=A0A841J9U0_9SPHN|nr:hypothetical protein [Sphingobium subterraneum]